MSLCLGNRLASAAAAAPPGAAPRRSAVRGRSDGGGGGGGGKSLLALGGVGKSAPPIYRSIDRSTVCPAFPLMQASVRRRSFWPRLASSVAAARAWRIWRCRWTRR